ncbi:MAG: hypothetical protein LC737_08120 [Chloroflexi bacterium]|nr:hypothetical protein [Chloroflexota bacterium]
MPTLTYEQLARASNGQLEQIFRAGKAPRMDALLNFEWRGYNMTPVARLLGIQKFIKGFFASSACVEGYNIAVQQNGLSEDWIAQPSAEQPKRYAFFVVQAVDPRAVDNRYRDALLLDYGASTRNPRFGIERRLRDYLVQPDPANADLLLGKAYFAFGSLRVFSNFFIIERLRPTNWTP